MSWTWLKSHLTPKIKSAYLCLYTFLIIVFYAYYEVVIPTVGDVMNHAIPEVDILGDRKCTLNYRGCEYDRFTAWSIGRMIVFAIVGTITPDRYSTIVLYSAITEALLYSRGGNPRIATNAITNILGYTIGSNLKMLISP